MRLEYDRRTKEEIAHDCGFDEHVRLGQVFDLLWRGYSIVQIGMHWACRPQPSAAAFAKLKDGCLHLYIQMITPLPDGRGFFNAKK